MLSQLQRAQLNNARTVGGTPSVYVRNAELLYLLCVVCRDLDVPPPQAIPCDTCTSANMTFYDIPIDEIYCSGFEDTTEGNQIVESNLYHLTETNTDIFTYFWALTNLHAQRRKYRAILDIQPLPELETIIPRGLLELGTMPADVLASWLVWRKFIYDIDNRAAQTTGYLFEPILAASIGGVSYSAQKSPVKRQGTGSGRQVDCIVNKDAYEFKMRVTIAASGQGRFAEELSFAEDCHLSGYRPVLLVLDPTPSSRLDELTSAFEKYDGVAYIGVDAWSHLEAQAGEIMARFLKRYVHEPIALLDKYNSNISPVSLKYDTQANRIDLTIGNERFQVR
ncbi:MAG: restriction endonuclease [Chloroflexi bacterium]|nr:MAG: restriction endonuclease [Chloroflexota bacterium]